jgi:hypothetical protein
MEEVQEYMIVSGSSMADLTGSVLRFRKMGYFPLGGISAVCNQDGSHYCYQAMIHGNVVAEMASLAGSCLTAMDVR